MQIKLLDLTILYNNVKLHITFPLNIESVNL